MIANSVSTFSTFNVIIQFDGTFNCQPQLQWANEQAHSLSLSLSPRVIQRLIHILVIIKLTVNELYATAYNLYRLRRLTLARIVCHRHQRFVELLRALINSFQWQDSGTDRQTAQFNALRGGFTAFSWLQLCAHCAYVTLAELT